MAQSARSLVLLSAAAVVLAAGIARARPSSEKHPAPAGGDPYEAARDAEGRLDYKAVVAHATAALQLANTHDRMVTLYSMLGIAYGVLNKTDEAVDAFTRLLAIDPDHHLPRGLSPKITKPFKEAGGYWIDRPGGLQVQPDLPREINSGKALTLSVKLDDAMKMAANVRLTFRHEGETEYDKMETPAASSVTFTLPPEQIPPHGTDYVIEVYFSAIGPTGSELRSAGDAAHPLSMTVRASHEPEVVLKDANRTGPLIVTKAPPPKPKKPLIKQWWLWTAVGVVVVGAALGGGLGYYFSRDTAHVDGTISSRIGP